MVLGDELGYSGVLLVNEGCGVNPDVGGCAMLGVFGIPDGHRRRFGVIWFSGWLRKEVESCDEQGKQSSRRREPTATIGRRR